MLVSEIIINPKNKTMDQMYNDTIGKVYNVYESHQHYTDNFTVSPSLLYDTDTIHRTIYYIVDTIEQMKDDNIPEQSQIMIALNELLDYFNK